MPLKIDYDYNLFARITLPSSIESRNSNQRSRTLALRKSYTNVVMFVSSNFGKLCIEWNLIDELAIRLVLNFYVLDVYAYIYVQ